MHSSLVENYIQNRLKVIQKKHNFDPNDGVEQIVNCPDKLVDYKIFSELIKLVKDCSLSVEVPYDPCGLSSSSMVKCLKASILLKTIIVGLSLLFISNKILFTDSIWSSNSA